jgi:hypothetical protein
MIHELTIDGDLRRWYGSLQRVQRSEAEPFLSRR